jgi:hypothetical protein
MVENPMKKKHKKNPSIKMEIFLLPPFRILRRPLPNNQHFYYNHVIELSPVRYTKKRWTYGLSIEAESKILHPLMKKKKAFFLINKKIKISA